ncbi:MAG: D-glycero-beta-D-manno-heptose-7-phosphate kinase [Candidatus Omnitrophica bacterium]|nr:D-glycero-beta-D-manno-heptose-7-phosphate kinase [Candidatus Omnitrophota bacterium]
MKEKLFAAIKRFKNAKVLVVGDLMLDEYIWGDVERISPEAPVPVVWAQKRTFVPGGAANVANNLRSLGAQVYLVGVIGKDHHSQLLLDKLENSKIDINGIVQDSSRPTTLKTRIFARHQQMLRLDWEQTHLISKKIAEKIFKSTEKIISKMDALILEDYGKGLFYPDLLCKIIGIAKEHNRIITVDPKEEHFEFYQQVTAITPNRKEAQNAIRSLKMRDERNEFKIYHDKLTTEEDIRKAGYAILKHLKLDNLLITLGEDGMWLFTQKEDKHIPTVAQEVFDVSGAGDTVIATFTLALCIGSSPSEAAHLANFAAGIVVGKVGTASTNPKELEEKIKSFYEKDK